MSDRIYTVDLYWPEITLLISDAEAWARHNEDSAYKMPPGPERDGFMRGAMDLQSRANELKKIMETQKV